METGSTPPRFLLLTPGDLEPPSVAPFLAQLAPLLDAGLPGLLVREERLLDRAFLDLAAAIRALLRGRALWLGVHDRAHLAESTGARAVHLGFRSLPPRLARDEIEPGVALGLSTHADDDPSAWGEADYLFHGPVHATPSKAGWKAPIGVEGLARAVRASPRPILALGGVLPEHVSELLAAGAHGVAVRAGVLASPAPARALERYLAEVGAS
jgi:thiamine-phosphate pyrophosphorylase